MQTLAQQASHQPKIDNLKPEDVAQGLCGITC